MCVGMMAPSERQATEDLNAVEMCRGPACIRSINRGQNRSRDGRTTMPGECGPVPGTVEIASEHEVDTSAAMPGTDIGERIGEMGGLKIEASFDRSSTGIRPPGGRGIDPGSRPLVSAPAPATVKVTGSGSGCPTLHTFCTLCTFHTGRAGKPDPSQGLEACCA